MRSRPPTLVKAKLEQIRRGFPARPRAQDACTTRRSSCKRRSRRWSSTFVEALILVLIVVFLFLQSWRATLIPMLAVPVSLVGDLRGLRGARASASTRCRCSAWCSRSASWSTTRSSWSRPSSTTCRRASCRRRKRPARRWTRCRAGRRDRAGARGGLHPDGLHPGRDRAALQAVRDDRRGVDHVLGTRRA